MCRKTMDMKNRIKRKPLTLFVVCIAIVLGSAHFLLPSGVEGEAYVVPGQVYVTAAGEWYGILQDKPPVTGEFTSVQVGLRNVLQGDRDSLITSLECQFVWRAPAQASLLRLEDVPDWDQITNLEEIPRMSAMFTLEESHYEDGYNILLRKGAQVSVGVIEQGMLVRRDENGDYVVNCRGCKKAKAMTLQNIDLILANYRIARPE